MKAIQHAYSPLKAIIRNSMALKTRRTSMGLRPTTRRTPLKQ